MINQFQIMSKLGRMRRAYQRPNQLIRPTRKMSRKLTKLSQDSASKLNIIGESEEGMSKREQQDLSTEALFHGLSREMSKQMIQRSESVNRYDSKRPGHLPFSMGRDTSDESLAQQSKGRSISTCQHREI